MQEIDLPADKARRLRLLIESQFYRQRMYSSCAFFFADLDSHSTHYGIANAAYAILLTTNATGIDLGDSFRTDLKIALGSDLQTGETLTGSEVYDSLRGDLHSGS